MKKQVDESQPKVSVKRTQKKKKNQKPLRQGAIKQRRVQKHMVTSGNAASNQDPRVQITASVDLDAYTNCFRAVASYLAQRNVININTEANPQQWRAIYEGITYLLQGGTKNFSGSVDAVGSLPVVFDNLLQALMPKSLNWDCGQIMYGAQPVDGSGLLLGPFSVYGHTWNPTFVINDGGGSSEIAGIYPIPAQAENFYPTFKSIVTSIDKNGMLKSVDWKSTPTLSRDVSAFARVYSYVGNQSVPQLGGAWLDVENEVQVRAPMMAKFVKYQLDSAATDPRLPGDLKPHSMDALSCTGWPLHDSFAGYYNKTPPRINQIDADQVFIVLCYWMIQLKAKALSANKPGAADSLPFTQQSFYLVVRSALLAMYDNQYFTQFLGNNQFQPGFNAFLGFLVMGHCAGSPSFGQLRVPTILAENLASLKARNVSSTETGRNPKTYLPIVGRFYKDTLPTFVLVDEAGVVGNDLFQPPGTFGEDVIDVIDCSTGALSPINVQGTYYKTVLSDWNSTVEKYIEYSASVQELVNDGGPRGLLACMSTRVLKSTPIELEGPPKVPARLAECIKTIKNKRFDYIKEKGLQRVNSVIVDPKNPKALPDASVLSLFTETILSRFPISQEALELFETIILPTDRSDDFNDVLRKQMIQVMGKEAYSYTDAPTNSVPGTGAGEYQRLVRYANEMITGAGKDTATKFQLIFGELITQGHGGLLAGLLGGVVNSIFPGNEALVNTVASIVPF